MKRDLNANAAFLVVLSHLGLSISAGLFAAIFFGEHKILPR